LRPFSFTIALVSCGLGVAVAAARGAFHLGAAAGVVAAGLLFQAGVNLVNDYFEFKQRRVDDKLADLRIAAGRRTGLERGIFASGLACLALIAPIGIWLATRAGPGLVALGALGMAGAYFYTGEPLNYKRRGLAVVLVFFLMGVLMVWGADLAVAGTPSADAFWISLPVSALVSLLLLSNELRDAEDDARHGIRTLTVRVGYPRAVALYVALVVAAYAGAVALSPHPWLVLLSVVALPAPLRLLHAPREQRRAITPLTARFHLAFGALYTLTFLG
jgi:1,4-dihydroxy-2-naphthoate octaprenyltransferase